MPERPRTLLEQIFMPVPRTDGQMPGKPAGPGPIAPVREAYNQPFPAGQKVAEALREGPFGSIHAPLPTSEGTVADLISSLFLPQTAGDVVISIVPLAGPLKVAKTEAGKGAARKIVIQVNKLLREGKSPSEVGRFLEEVYPRTYRQRSTGKLYTSTTPGAEHVDVAAEYRLPNELSQKDIARDLGRDDVDEYLMFSNEDFEPGWDVEGVFVPYDDYNNIERAISDSLVVRHRPSSSSVKQKIKKKKKSRD